ncbi:MAG: hypothetical protein IKU24_05645, partial [Clostridia bacterium]|nr:hypothetical protein [Clostridia bacterium]
MNLEIMKPKKLYFSIAISFLLALIFLSLALYFGGKGSYGGAFLKDDVSISVISSKSGEVFLDEKKSAPVPQGTVSLKIRNNEKKSLQMYLYQSGIEKGKFSLASGEETDAEIESDGTALSVLIGSGKKENAYLSDMDSLVKIAEKMKSGGDLTALLPLKSKSVFFHAPFRLFGDFSFEEINFETSLSGKIVLKPKNALRAKIYVQAQNCSLFFDRFTPDFEKSERDYYLKAESQNGEKLSLLSYPISSF